MKILRVFNNNVVLAKDGAREVIVTGRGLGFQAKPGQRVDDAKIVRVFVPADGRDPDHIAELLSEIPPEIIRLVTDAMTATGLAEQAESQPTLVMALADHITGAVQRRSATSTSHIRCRRKSSRCTRPSTRRPRGWSMNSTVT